MGALEDRLNPPALGQSDPDVKVVKMRAGQKCPHWAAGADGRRYVSLPNMCVLCYGSNKLVADVNFRFHRRKKTMLRTYYPADLPSTELMPSSARRPYEDTPRARQVA